MGQALFKDGDVPPLLSQGVVGLSAAAITDTRSGVLEVSVRDTPATSEWREQ